MPHAKAATSRQGRRLRSSFFAHVCACACVLGRRSTGACTARLTAPEADSLSPSLQSECEEAERRIQARTASIAEARERLGALKQKRDALARRLDTAAAAQAAVLSRVCNTPHAPLANPHTLAQGASVAAQGGDPKHAATALASEKILQLLNYQATAAAHATASRVPSRSAHTHVHRSGARAAPATPLTHLYAASSPWRTDSQNFQPSRSLFEMPSATPPPLDTFPHHAAISYADLLEASGSRTGIIDVSSLTAGELMSRFMAESVERMGCAAEEVAWFAQMESEAAPGLPLSYSCTLSTPECIASCALHCMVLYLECALISTVLGLPGAHMPGAPPLRWRAAIQHHKRH